MRVSNGVTSVIMNYVKKLQGQSVQLDFIALYNRESPYVDELEQMGCGFWILPQKSGKIDFVRSYQMIRRILQDGNYDIVHSHLTGKYSVLLEGLAKFYHVPCRVLHSHNPRDIHDLKSRMRSWLYDNLNVYFSNYYAACSISAGRSYFKKRKFVVIKNAITVEKYAYSKEAREKGRRELGISEKKIVVGTVCRQTYQKNPFFLVDVFEKFYKMNPDSILIWVGTGELIESVSTYVKKKGLDDQIQFVGNRSDMKEMYSTMDLFLLPSKFEGLGIVFIEAQACGLLSFASCDVPNDVKVTELLHQISLNDSAEQWAVRMSSAYKKLGKVNRENAAEQVKKSGYDIQENNDLYSFYKNILI